MDPKELKQKNKINWQRLLITMAIVVVTTAAVGASVYYPMERQAKIDKDAAENVTQALQKQIEELEKSVEKEAIDADPEVAAPKLIKEFDLKTLSSSNIIGRNYQKTLYGDLTGDGSDEAVVIFTYDGTGAYRDFYIYGVLNDQPKLLYAKEGIGKATVEIKTDSTNALPIVTAIWVDPNDPENINKPNSDMSPTRNTSRQYVWNGSAFIESYLQQ